MFLRWLACSDLQCAAAPPCVLEDDNLWPEKPFFVLWWQRAEENIWNVSQLYMVQHSLVHLSLHLDGLRVDWKSLREMESGASLDKMMARKNIALMLRPVTHGACMT